MTPLRLAHLSSISNSGNNSDGKSEMKPPETGSNSPTTVSAVAVVAKRSKRGRTVVLKDGKGGEMRESCRGSDSEHEIHIWTERERRKKMRNMFSGLHALLPQLPVKADKSTIVDEAVNYIKTLQTTLQMLENKKLEMLRAGASRGYNPPDQMMMAATQICFLEHREGYMANQGAASKESAMEDHLDPSFGVLTQQLPPCFHSWSSPNVILSVNGLDAHISVCATKKPGLLVAMLYILEKYMLDVITLQISTRSCRSMYMIHAHAKGTISDPQFPEAMVVEEVFKLAVEEIIVWLSS